MRLKKRGYHNPLYNCIEPLPRHSSIVATLSFADSTKEVPHSAVWDCTIQRQNRLGGLARITEPPSQCPNPIVGFALTHRNVIDLGLWVINGAS